MNRFSAEALNWDKSPIHHTTAKHSLKALIANGLLAEKDADVLEIGCGTGLLTFLVRPHVRSIIGVDTAKGMIEVFQAKIQACDDDIRGVCTEFSTIDDPQVQAAATELANNRNQETSSPKRFSLITSLLTMHHIADHSAILGTMFDSLRPGGKVALVDYEDFGPEARLFHPVEKYEGVEHHGIKRDRTQDLLRKAGFVEVGVTTAFELSKEADREGEKDAMLFPFLLCVGTKPSS